MNPKIVDFLDKAYPAQNWFSTSTPFEVLVAVILSQNTSDRNSIPAFKNLKKKYKITPSVLAKANKKSIASAIKQAGLHNTKADKIVKVSKELLKKNLNQILKLPTDKARAELIALPGVGDKTADVVLSFVAGKETFPVDTHIKRITKRLGMVSENATYSEITESWKKIVPHARRSKIHIALIEHGRETCKARNPKCEVCCIKNYCNSYRPG